MIFAETNLRYNGKLYQKGDIIEGLDDETEIDRLVASGAILRLKKFEPEIKAERTIANRYANDEQIPHQVRDDMVLGEKENKEVDYSFWDYKYLKKLVRERNLKLKYSTKKGLEAALAQDDREFYLLADQLQDEGLDLPDEATREQLEELSGLVDQLDCLGVDIPPLATKLVLEELIEKNDTWLNKMIRNLSKSWQ